MCTWAKKFDPTLTLRVEWYSFHHAGGGFWEDTGEQMQKKNQKQDNNQKFTKKKNLEQKQSLTNLCDSSYRTTYQVYRGQHQTTFWEN